MHAFTSRTAVVRALRSFHSLGTLSILAVAVGAVGSVAAHLFVETVHWLHSILLVPASSRTVFDDNPMLLALVVIAVPTAGGVAVGHLIDRHTDNGTQHTPSDVIATVQVGTSFPSRRSAGVSTLASIISLGCGASVGQYGPLVVLGAMIGRAAGSLKLRIESPSSIFVACGVAAAIATAFNAPIAGLVFAHEVVHRHYSIRAFAPTVVAAATGHVAGNLFGDRQPLFLVEFEGVAYDYEFLLFAIVGVFSALVAIAYMRAIIGCTALSNRVPLPRPIRAGLAGLVVGVTGILLPELHGLGTDALRMATVEGVFSPAGLFVLVTVKIVLTALCLGFGFAGGIVNPALLVGILFGALCWFGVDVATLQQNSGIVPYAICGMMAVASSAVGAPLATILIVFELTRNYDLTIAVMVGVALSVLVSTRFFGKSYYDAVIEGGGIDLKLGAAEARLSQARAADCAIAEFRRCTEDCSVRQFLNCGPYDWNEIYVEDAKGMFLGVICRNATDKEGEVTAASVARMPELAFHPDTTLTEAMHAVSRFDGDTVPVLCRDQLRLAAVVVRRDLEAAYLKTIDETMRQENAVV